MDLELSLQEQPWARVFKPVDLLPASRLAHHSVQLENSFHLAPDQPQVLLTLAGPLLFLSEGRG
jgi:hypothetical protein